MKHDPVSTKRARIACSVTASIKATGIVPVHVRGHDHGSDYVNDAGALIRDPPESRKRQKQWFLTTGKYRAHPPHAQAVTNLNLKLASPIMAYARLAAHQDIRLR